ncbi:AAA family ATPase [Mycolicibacter heraklionensis]|uniref:AAA family ATPase n=1 Tax=Mycolicibacter heraklionensis TaxID=512402 RepID=UPI00069C9BD6|nr:AAA family ATPase [Mycolicibacter heraklionensis]
MSSLVGRSRETRAIAELLNDAADASTGLIIEGEPGIGKTTLWLEGLQRARQHGFRVLAARASAAESVLAYAVLADLLSEVDRDLWADLPSPQRHGLAAAILNEDEIVSPAVKQRAVGAAFLAVLNKLADESPVMVAIDDLQWLDPASAAAVAFAARRLSGRVAWLCTTRSGTSSAPAGSLELSRPDSVRRISLPPLMVGELQDVLTSHLGSPIPRPRMLRIHQISGGNPFYALELAREIDPNDPTAYLRLPASLGELTYSRISRIEGDVDDALLAIASSADPTIRVVSQVIGLAPQHLLEMLDTAEMQQIITIEGNRIRFTHPLLAHAVHMGATPPARRRMHRRLAEVITQPELHARHLALADPVGEPETLNALDDAAEIARGRGAAAAAAELLELAIGFGGTTEERRIRLAQCLFDAGDSHRAGEVLKAAIADLTPGPRRAEALQQLAMVRLYDDSFLDAWELCRQAVADCADDSELRVIVMTTLAFTQLNIGQPGAALATAEEAATLAERIGPSEGLSRALGMREMMRFFNGEGAAVANLHRAANLERLDTPVPVALRPSMHSALLRGWTGDLVEARESLEEIRDRCEADGEEGEMDFIAFQSVMFDVWLGNLPRAADTANEAMRRACQFGGDAAQFIASSLQSVVASYQGRVEDARRHIDLALAAGRASGYVTMLSTPITAHGFLELSLGDHAKALAAVEPLLPMVHLAPRFTEIVACGFVPDAAEALIHLDRLDEAERLIEILEGNGARLNRAWMLAVGARCRALMSAARGDVATAVTYANTALAHHDRIEMPFERARTLLVLGRLERRLRHWQTAAAVLAESLQTFEKVGTPLWASQVRAELDRGTAGRTRSPGLTPTERRIAELAATGMNNHDIATMLFITRKTVEVNLSRIYRKLAIHSRIELYRVMAQAGPSVLPEDPAS